MLQNIDEPPVLSYFVASKGE